MDRKNNVSPEGRLECARVGSANLKAWRASHDADAQRARELSADFERRLREEIGPDASAIGLGLIESAVASYACMVIVSLKLRLGSQRLDRLKELHALLVESQRNLYRVLKALQIDDDRPAAKEARRERLLERIRGDLAVSRADTASNAIEKETSDVETTQGT